MRLRSRRPISGIQISTNGGLDEDLQDQHVGGAAPENPTSNTSDAQVSIDHDEYFTNGFTAEVDHDEESVADPIADDQSLGNTGSDAEDAEDTAALDEESVTIVSVSICMFVAPLL